MSSPLSGKVAIITGGSKGIGAATAAQLVSKGASVVVTYSSDAASAEKVVAELGKEHVLAVKSDTSSSTDNEALVKQTVDRFGRIDFLLLNAAYVPMKSLEDTTEETFDTTISTNIKGPYFLIQKAVPHMPSGGRVVLFSTSLSTVSNIAPHYLLYMTSKGAVEQMTRVLSKDLGRRGITVNAISPGPTITESFLAGKSEELLQTMATWNPFNRLGQPGDIASATIMLLGEEGRWISGQTIKVNGGMS